MPRAEPPWPFKVELVHTTIAAGTPLWRCVEQKRVGELFRHDFADVHADGRTGGRFDATAHCSYPFGYVATDVMTALAETILRDAPYEAAGRLIPRVRFVRRAVVCLESDRPLQLVRLVEAADLAAARQDTWLVHAEPRDYPMTRRWAEWFRACSPRADGLVWPSKRHPGGQVAVLFGDDGRCGRVLRPSPFGTRFLGDPDGERWLAGLLEPLSTYLTPLADRSAPHTPWWT